MERNELTLEQEMRRVWDVEQVKQLMHKRVFLQTWDRRQEELDTLWVTDPELQKTASYGSNWGYYVGMEAIRGYYVDAHQARLEEQRAANGAQEVNVGNMYAHPLTTGLVELRACGTPSATRPWLGPMAPPMFSGCWAKWRRILSEKRTAGSFGTSWYPPTWTARRATTTASTRCMRTGPPSPGTRCAGSLAGLPWRGSPTT